MCNKYIWSVNDPREFLASIVLGLFIYLLAVWMLVVVQETLNRFWQKVQPGLEMRSQFSGKEILLILLGSIAWILSLTWQLIPEIATIDA